MVEEQVLVFGAGVRPHRFVVGRENGGLAELEQRGHQLVARQYSEKLTNENKKSNQLIIVIAPTTHSLRCH